MNLFNNINESNYLVKKDSNGKIDWYGKAHKTTLVLKGVKNIALNNKVMNKLKAYVGQKYSNSKFGIKATQISDTDELQSKYISYQLHYSYLVRQCLSNKEITDFTLLFSALMWSKYLYNFSLPDTIPAKNHAYQPTLQDLSPLRTYFLDHYTYERDFDFQMCFWQV